MEYQPSKFWQQLNKDCDRLLAERGYENFKNTLGLIYNNYYFDGIKLADDYEERLRHFWELLYQTLPYNLLVQFDEPSEGNPLTIEFNGRRVSFDLGMSLYEYNLLFSYIDFSKVKVIHEIGAGYGRTAYVISKLHPDINYRIFDVEPSLGIARRYLTSVNPDGRFKFNTPDKLEVPCDLLIAIDCLHEMTQEHVAEYFDYADKNARYFYFSVFEKTHTPLDELDWEIKDYPKRETWNTLLSRKHLFRQEAFEVLYQCQR